MGADSYTSLVYNFGGGDMDVLVTDPDLRELCNSREAADRHWGEDLARLVAGRLDHIWAAEDLAELARLPGARVTGDHANVLIDYPRHRIRLVGKVRPSEEATANAWLFELDSVLTHHDTHHDNLERTSR